MNSITNFLQKFLSLEKDNNLKISIILDTIKNITGIEVSKEILDIKGDTLKIKCNPVLRNEIFMHQHRIETTLQSNKIYLKII
jgi:hypothetical protein